LGTWYLAVFQKKLREEDQPLVKTLKNTSGIPLPRIVTVNSVAEILRCIATPA
jgi:hypothetical protein